VLGFYTFSGAKSSRSHTLQILANRGGLNSGIKLLKAEYFRSVTGLQELR